MIRTKAAAEKKEPLALHCRAMRVMDRAWCVAIDSAVFEDAWGEDGFRVALRAPFMSVGGIVAESCDRLAGFAVYAASGPVLRVLRLAVAPDLIRRGVGSFLLNELVGRLRPGMRERLVIDVGELNLAGQKFLSARGLRATGVLRDYYGPGNGDAYAFKYDLPPAPLRSDELVHGGL